MELPQGIPNLARRQLHQAEPNENPCRDDERAT
jgi:hypothetical protein